MSYETQMIDTQYLKKAKEYINRLDRDRAVFNKGDEERTDGGIYISSTPHHTHTGKKTTEKG